jgi:hypothetical protein
LRQRVLDLLERDLRLGLEGNLSSGTPALCRRAGSSAQAWGR